MKKKKWTVGKILEHVFLILWLLLCLFPLYWMFTMSLKDTNEIFGGNVVGLPTQWLWENYANAWGSGGRVSSYLLNSVIDTFATLILTSFFGFMASYGLLRMRWKGQKAVFTYLLMGMMIPMHAALYPLTETLLSLTKTNWALIIPYTAFNIPITVLFVFRDIGCYIFGRIVGYFKFQLGMVLFYAVKGSQNLSRHCDCRFRLLSGDGHCHR